MSRCAAWLAAASAAMSVALAALAWQRRRLPYGEAGQHFDGLVNTDEQSALAYAALALVTGLVALALFVLHRLTRRH